MNLQPDVIRHLQSLLRPVDNFPAFLRDLRSKIEQADSARQRLEVQIADTDRQLSEISSRRIKPDAKRLAALVSGAEVKQPDKQDIEGRAFESRVVEARREQFMDDLRAVGEHLAELRDEADAGQRAYDKAELALLVALGDAHMEAYKQAAIAFVRSQVAPLHALANAIAVKSGTLPVWWNFISGALKIHWHEPDVHYPRLVNVWPRQDGTLVSGEQMSSLGGVGALIAAVRKQ